MALLEFVFILLLQTEGISGGSIYLYNKPGDEVVLPCSIDSSFRCSDVEWLHNRDVNSATELKVIKGKVNENSAGAARLSVNSNCSLIINSITDEDVGRYVCRLWDRLDLDSIVHLNILTLSPSPPDAYLQKEEVTLTCSILKYIGVCRQNSIRWLDDEGTELLGKGDGYEFIEQRNCVSNLTVKHQSDHNRRFTCQFVEGNIVKIEAHYTPDSTAGISGGIIELYNKPGDEVVIPCNGKTSSSSCSSVDWLYHRDINAVYEYRKVIKGKVNENSARAARLSVNSDCSLIINSITDEDVGRYVCRLWDRLDLDSTVHLNILTLSPSPPDADLQKEEVMLTCSLLKYSNIGLCRQNSIRWLDDGGTELLGKGDGYEFIEQRNCVSNLTVKHQSDHNRRFTCQFVEGNNVKIEAHYTPDSTDSTDWSPLRCFMLTLRITGLILLIGIAVDVIRRGIKKLLKESNVSEVVDEDAVKYENVGDHSAAPTLR